MVRPDGRQVKGRCSWDLLNSSIYNPDMQHLTNLRVVFNLHSEYQLTFRPLIFRIIASNLQTIEVLDMKKKNEKKKHITITKVCIEKVFECWTRTSSGLLIALTPETKHPFLVASCAVNDHLKGI